MSFVFVGKIVVLCKQLTEPESARLTEISSNGEALLVACL